LGSSVSDMRERERERSALVSPGGGGWMGRRGKELHVTGSACVDIAIYKSFSVCLGFTDVNGILGRCSWSLRRRAWKSMKI